ncbi:MAG TPA: hypothetical protein VMW62_17005 [Chloroflexota bacterium]|nr:hypothetical protein [Chloroflexota bacterium]
MLQPQRMGESQPVNGPLADLLNGLTGKKPRARNRSRADLTERRYVGGSRTHFLAELEVTGAPATAARIAQCSLADVRAWRAVDPMFDRDYALALISHLKALTRMVREMSELHESPQVRQGAQHLLGTEGRYLGDDGRLDARAWRDALASFAHSLGVDLAWWEPAGEEAAPEPGLDSGSSAA